MLCLDRLARREPRDRRWNKSRELSEDLAAYFDDRHQNIGLLLE